jgi:predicted DNA-binding antitoxin AbrB/MazE fold protein
MTGTGELAVVYESGVLRPEQPLDLPDHTRVVIAIRRIETSPESEAEGRRLLDEIRHRGDIRLAGWRPTRDELHERD